MEKMKDFLYPRRLMYIAVLMLAACQSLGVPQADTFNKRAVAAYSSVSAASQTVTTLYVSQKITQEKALESLDEVEQVKKAVDAAVQLYSTDRTGAETRLDDALLILKALQAAIAAGGPS